MAEQAGWLLLGAVIGFVARQYLSGYLPEKGRHLATKEDFQDILEQLHSTTQTVELIKMQTSGDLWLGQERWNLKRKIYVSLLHGLSDARIQLQRMSAVISELEFHRTPEEVKAIQARLVPEVERFKRAVGSVRRARVISALVLNSEALAALDKLNNESVDAARAERYDEKYRVEISAIIDRAMELLTAAASKDLLGLRG